MSSKNEVPSRSVSEDQWLGLTRIGLDQCKTLKAVCLDDC